MMRSVATFRALRRGARSLASSCRRDAPGVAAAFSCSSGAFHVPSFWLGPVVQRGTTIGHEHRAGDEPRCWRAEEGTDLGDLVRPAEAVRRNRAFLFIAIDRIAHLRMLFVTQRSGVDRTRSERVDRHVVTRPVIGQRTREVDHTSAGRARVRERVRAALQRVDVHNVDHRAVPLRNEVRPHAAAHVPRAFKLRSITARQPRSVISEGLAGYWPPALLIRKSMRPYASSVADTSASTWATSRMSVGHGRHTPPAAVMIVAVSVSVSMCRPATTTRAPSAAKRQAIARPIPVPPPVTIAARPANRPGWRTCASFSIVAPL